MKLYYVCTHTHAHHTHTDKDTHRHSDIQTTYTQSNLIIIALNGTQVIVCSSITVATYKYEAGTTLLVLNPS